MHLWVYPFGEYMKHAKAAVAFVYISRALDGSMSPDVHATHSYSSYVYLLNTDVRLLMSA
jgi:hypothetical protein